MKIEMNVDELKELVGKPVARQIIASYAVPSTKRKYTLSGKYSKKKGKKKMGSRAWELEDFETLVDGLRKRLSINQIAKELNRTGPALRNVINRLMTRKLCGRSKVLMNKNPKILERFELWKKSK